MTSFRLVNDEIFKSPEEFHTFVVIVLQKLPTYVFCPQCDMIYPWHMAKDCNRIVDEHQQGHGDEGIAFPGMMVKLDWISESEEQALMDGIDGLPWDTSQSGRRKQNYGPKTNFKKMKLKPGDFQGFPAYSKFLQERFEEVELMRNYHTIEQCSLEYDPTKGASIDPHIDDCWIWGERVVTVNCLSDSVLTLTPYVGDKARYNLPQVDKYRSKLIDLPEVGPELGADVVVRVPMPRRSLLVMYGPPRYDFEHSVLREDVNSRRVCIAYREFTPPYLDEHAAEYQKAGKEILDIGRNFWTDPEKQLNTVAL